MCVGRAVRTLCGGGGQEELCASRLLQAAEHAACLRREEGAWALCGDALAGSPSVTIQSGAAPYVGLRLGSRHTGAHISPGGGAVPPQHGHLHCGGVECHSDPSRLLPMFLVI